MSPDGVRSSGGARRREWPASWWRATDKQRSRHKRQSIPSIPGLRRQATRKLFYPDTSRPKVPKEKEAKRKRPVEKWIPKRPHFPTGPTTTTTGTNPSFAHASQRTRHKGHQGSITWAMGQSFVLVLGQEDSPPRHQGHQENVILQTGQSYCSQFPAGLTTKAQSHY